ncbi:MAG: tol-pal system protein YbgF [Gammaproteobacteria bacterium]
MATSKRVLLLAAGLALAQPAWALFGVGEMNARVEALQKRVDTIDARLAGIEAAVQDKQQILDLLKEVDALKAELARVRGQAEVQAHQLDTLGKRQNDLYADLDQRMGELSKSAAAAATAQAVPADVATPGDPALESRSYEAALKLFRDADYPAAIAGFGEFLKAYPSSTLAANAQYWIGYSYFAQKDYKTSLAHQQKLLATYPASNKVPDALFNIAANQLALNETAAGRKTLEEIVAKHPGTQAATLAARRLAELK